MSESSAVFELLRHFAATMVSAFDVNEVLHETCEHTVAILDASAAGVSVAVDQRLRFVTAMTDDVVAMEEVQERDQTGPCVEAFQSGEIVAISDLSQVDRWPASRRVADERGIRSVVGIPLQVRQHRIGSINVYDTRVRDWNAHDLEAARVIADVATTYLLRAGELTAARQLGDQLQHALDTRVVIEQAKGMLAHEHDISVDRAFEILRRTSQKRGITVRSLATSVVNNELKLPSAPPPPPRRQSR